MKTYRLNDIKFFDLSDIQDFGEYLVIKNKDKLDDFIIDEIQKRMAILLYHLNLKQGNLKYIYYEYLNDHINPNEYYTKNKELIDEIINKINNKISTIKVEYDYENI